MNIYDIRGDHYLTVTVTPHTQGLTTLHVVRMIQGENRYAKAFEHEPSKTEIAAFITTAMEERK